MDSLTNGRTHPRPRHGDKAVFVYEKDEQEYEGQIFIDNMNRVLFGFNSPKVGIKNELEWIPYRRTVVMGEAGLIKTPVLWFDARDFYLKERNGVKIYYPGDEYFSEEFNRVFVVAETIGDAMVCCANGMCLTILQPSLKP